MASLGSRAAVGGVCLVLCLALVPVAPVGRAADEDGWGCGPAPVTERPEPTERPRRTPRPEPTPDASPDATATPDVPVPTDPVPTPDGRPSPDPTRAPDPDPTPGPTAPPEDTPRPEPTAEPEPEPERTPRPERTPEPEPERTPRPERTPDPEPDRTPRPERTPEPEPTREPGPEPSAVALALAGADDGPPSGVRRIIRRAVALVFRALWPWSSGPVGVDRPPRRVPPARPDRPDRPRGLDVSHWNGVVDHAAAARGGFGFLIAKATQGTYLTDPLLARNIAGARAAGLVVGAYHFYDFRQGGVEQADHLLGVLASVGLLADALPPVVDIECFGPFGSADQAAVRRELRAFSDRVFQRTGRLPMIYTSGLMWREVTGDDPSFGDHPLWVACWRCPEPWLPPGWEDWLVWQVGSMAVPGRSSRLDGNVARGPDALRRAVGPAVWTGAGGRVARLTGVDAGSEVRTAVGDGAWSGWDRRASITLPDADGRHRVRWRTRSARGVAGPVRERVVVVDRTPPVIGLRAPPAGTGAVAGSAVRLGLLVRDAVSGVGRVEARAVCGDRASGWTRLATGARSLVVPSPTAGVCRVEVRARDRSGNRAETALRLVVTRPSVVVARPTPEDPVPGHARRHVPT